MTGLNYDDDCGLIPLLCINEALSYDLLDGWPVPPGEPLTTEQYNYVFDNAREFEEKQKRLRFNPREGSCIEFLKKYPVERRKIR